MKVQWVIREFYNPAVEQAAKFFLPMGKDTFYCNICEKDVIFKWKSIFWCDVLQQCIWFNSHLKTRKPLLCNSQWFEKGMVNDLWENDSWITGDRLRQK